MERGRNESAPDGNVTLWTTYQSLVQFEAVDIPYLDSMIRRRSCQIPRENNDNKKSSNISQKQNYKILKKKKEKKGD